MDTWRIIEEKFEPEKQHTRETVFTIGNGYLGTRGTFEESYPGEMAATLVHGVFDQAPLVHSELVNTPNWTSFQLFANGERFRLVDDSHTIAYRRELDLGNGVLSRRMTWQLKSGQKLEIFIERFASLADIHLLCVCFKVKSIDFTGRLEFRAALFGHADNTGLLHWDWLDQGQIDTQNAFILRQPRQSKINLFEAFHLGLSDGKAATYEYWDSIWSPELVARVEIQPGQEVAAEKIVSVYTSRESPNLKEAGLKKLEEAVKQGYQTLRAANQRAWEREWEQCNITIAGDDEVDLALRYYIFELLIAAPRYDDRVSIGAKSLSGFGYRGHVFWDTETFILPFFIYTRPEIARNLLLYRYNTLPAAREKAHQSGFEGAMYAWESAASGEENTPRWVSGPDGKALVRIWTGDIEIHISADIAFAVYQYWQVSGDDEFMRDYGAEIILDTARFWASRAEWAPDQDRYELNDVIGPDEYHEHIDNNMFTIEMARWNLKIAFQVLDWLRQTAPDKARDLETSLDLKKSRLNHWKDVIAKLYNSFDTETRLYEQFEGYFQRKDIDLQSFEPRKRSMQALLGIEPVQEYQVIKQPDVLMLLYMLGEEVDRRVLEANYAYYTPRTDISYGSSLGPAIQALLAAWLGDLEGAYRLFRMAVNTDLVDERGNSPEGIHAATAGGVWQACVLGFAGLKISGDGPSVNPNLPPHWKRLKFRIKVHGQPTEYDLRQETEGMQGIPRQPVRGAIFDLDGVLTDTAELHYRAWKRLADELGIPFNRQANEALRGVSRRESLLRMIDGRHYSEEELQHMMETKNYYYLELIQNLTPEALLPGARRFLEETRKNGIKIAIGSASKNAREVIEKLGISDLIVTISDGYSVQNQKPAPDLFLHAAGQLGIPPEQCVVFEDAESGVEAALAGGMWAVGIGPMERVGAANVIVNSLADTCWTCVVEQIQQVQVMRVALAEASDRS